MAVGFQPMVEVDLVEIGGDDFLAEFVGIDAEERDAQACERGDERLRDLVGIRGAVFVTGFHLAERGGDDQQAVGKRAHAAQARDEHGAFHVERAHEVVQVLALDDARILKPGNGVVADFQRPFFDPGKPASETFERKWILLARIDHDYGFWRAKLRAPAFGNRGHGGMSHRKGGHPPFERWSDECAASHGIGVR